MSLRRFAAFAAVLAALLADDAQAAGRRVSFPGEGGMTLQGWLYEPETPGPAPI